MIKEAGEPTDLFYCEFIKWDVRDDCTRGVSATPMTALKKAIYLFDNWLNFALNNCYPKDHVDRPGNCQTQVRTKIYLRTQIRWR